LEKLAQTIKENKPVTTSHTAGFFNIEEAEVSNGLVLMWLDKDKGEPLVLIQGPMDKILSLYGNNGIIVLDEDWCFYNSL